MAISGGNAHGASPLCVSLNYFSPPEIVRSQFLFIYERLPRATLPSFLASVKIVERRIRRRIEQGLPGF